MAKARPSVVPNQVFVGCPWSGIRPKYEAVIGKLKKKYPVSFIIVGRGDGQEAEDLLKVIKERIETSSFAIFDATNGNPNVSLEFGYAEGQGLRRAIYLSTHKASKKGSKDSPIIADLAGKKQNQYKQTGSLEKLLKDLSGGHEYTRRFEAFLTKSFKKSKPGEKKSRRAMALKLIHLLDGQRDVRRSDVVNQLLDEGYKSDEAEDMISRARSAGLLWSQQGPHSRVWLT